MYFSKQLSKSQKKNPQCLRIQILQQLRACNLLQYDYRPCANVVPFGPLLTKLNPPILPS